MAKESIIEINELAMEFNLSAQKVDNVKEYLIRRVKNQLWYQKFTALNHITFSMKPGESVGLIGLNGSGKSTLLKTVAGVLEPSRGTCNVNGKVAPLIELGAGFDMDLTAKENIWLSGAIRGFGRKFMKRHYDSIVAFAELDEFMDVPLKNFSSGMLARLAFAIATFQTPDILIVDEVLSVGDFLFQEKCEKRIKTLREEGAAILFVSHSMEQVRHMCQRAVWLEKGQIKMDGICHEVTTCYEKGGCYGE